MTRRLIFTCLLAMGLTAPALVYAEHTHFWRQSDYSDFEKGTAKVWPSAATASWFPRRNSQRSPTPI